MTSSLTQKYSTCAKDKGPTYTVVAELITVDSTDQQTVADQV